MKTFLLVFLLSLSGVVAFSQSYMLSKKEARQLVRYVKNDLKTISKLLESKTITTADIQGVLAGTTVSKNFSQRMLETMVRRINSNIQKLQSQSPYLGANKIKKIIKLDSKSRATLEENKKTEN